MEQHHKRRVHLLLGAPGVFVFLEVHINCLVIGPFLQLQGLVLQQFGGLYGMVLWYSSEGPFRGAVNRCQSVVLHHGAEGGRAPSSTMP